MINKVAYAVGRIIRRLRGITRIRVVRDVRGQWHDNTWYRVNMVFDCRLAKPPSAGWKPIRCDHNGTIAFDDAEVVK